MKERLIIALDVPSLQEAGELVQKLAGRVGYFKVGMELFYAAGPGVVREISALGKGTGVFLDLKLHDIPHTVESATRVLSGLGVSIINAHAAGGSEMLKAMRRGADSGAAGQGARPLLVAVTVLTAIDEKIFAGELGFTGTIAGQALKWSRLARASGLEGVVASAGEAQAIRQEMGEDFLIITPGIRPGGARPDDQRRVFTPGEAIRQGASHLVVGRPVTASSCPEEAVERILDEMQRTYREKQVQERG